MMDLTKIGTIKRLCNEYGIRPSKRMGQNFLVNQGVLKKIVGAGELRESDTVLEIGSGFGVLTRELAGRVGRVVAVEKDKRLAEYMKALKHENIKAKLEIINGDILKFQISDFRFQNYKVVSNLPYQITSPVLWKFLYPLPSSPFVRGRGLRPELMVLMVQKEVAERIVARPGQMSLLSILCQFYAKCEIVLTVKKRNFWPRPKVDSAIIKLTLKHESIKALKQRNLSEDLFFRIVKAGFANKRKMLRNNLVKGLGLTERVVLDGFEYVGLSEKVRAQELSVEDWVKLVGIIKS